MKLSEKLIGKVCRNKEGRLVTVDGVHENSRVLVDVTVIDRGKGWNEKTETYKGVRNSVGWYRGENREFGSKDTLNFKELTVL